MPRQRSNSQSSETVIQEVLDSVTSGTYRNIMQAAKAFGISPKTVYHRKNGRSSRVVAREAQQNLTIPEEEALVRWITQLTKTGYAPQHHLLRAMAEEIREQRAAGLNDASQQLVIYPPLGKEWVTRFLQRHLSLSTSINKSIELARMRDVSKPIVEEWFRNLRATVEEYGITPDNMYNMDESGFSLGTTENMRVIIDTEVPMQFQAQPGRQEWITAVECICADGSSLSPMLIFKGEQLSQAWISINIPESWKFSCNTKGWTSNAHGVEWLRSCFEPATREKAGSEYRMLICDGHDSHIAGEFILHCINNNILLVLLPPHSSHILQPLDVSIFGPLKKYIARAQQEVIRHGVARLQKCEFVDAYAIAREAALRPENVLSGWRASGIYPLNTSTVLRKFNIIDAPKTPPRFSDTPNQTYINLATHLDNSPDAMTLRAGNVVLTHYIQTPETAPTLVTPIRRYISHLAATSEKQQAAITILKRELRETKDVLAARKERKSGKRLALKGKFLVSTADIHKLVAEAESETKRKKESKVKKAKKVKAVAEPSRKGKEKESIPWHGSDWDSDDIPPEFYTDTDKYHSETPELDSDYMEDCIVVETAPSSLGFE